jgi:hypothetical protein
MAPYGQPQRALIDAYFNPRDPSGKPLPFKLPRNAGTGIKLPKISGLRIRRGVTTGKFGKRDVIVDATGKVYGLAAPGRFQIGTGNNAGFLSLVPKPKKGRGGGSGTPSTPGTPGTTTPPPDEYASYDKDYPWIAKYLRSIRDEETAFNKRYTTQIQPGVAAGLESLGRIGEGIATTYGGQVGTSAQQPGYVSNIYGAAANLTPAQVASGMGGAASVFDPNSVAARQGLASSASASAQADARYRSLMAGLSPVSTAQGILGGLASQAATISKSYADKRLSERVKLDQWIAEQKASAEDRLIKQQYNMALLGIKQDQLALDQQQLTLDQQKAAQQGVKTDTELAAEGFIKFEPEKIGPKNRAAAQRRAVKSREGTMWWKPGGSRSGSGSGSGGPTGNQRLQAQTALGAAYAGGQLDEKGQLLAGNIGTGYRDLPSLNAQAQSVAAFIRNAIQNGFLKNNAQDIGSFIYAGIPNPVVKDANDQYGAPVNPKTGKPLYKDTRRAMVNLVLSFLGLR